MDANPSPPSPPTAEPATYPSAMTSGMDGVVMVDAGPGYVGRRYLCRVWDRHARKYQNRRFDKPREARRWAEQTRAAFERGEATAGRLPMRTVLPAYLSHLRLKGDSATHIAAVARILGAVQLDLRSQAAEGIVLAHLAGLTDGRKRQRAETRDLAPSTRKAVAQCWVAFGNWLVAGNKVARSPFAGLPLARVPRVLQPFFRPSEGRLLVSNAALEHPVGLLVAVSLYAGLRLREALWLRWDQIDWTNGRINVRLPDQADRDEATALAISTDSDDADERWKAVKGNKERQARLEAELLGLLKPRAALSGYVFPSAFRTANRGKQHYRRQLAYLCRLVGVAKGNRRWHSLRNSCAAMLRGAGVGPDRIMDSLGHESAAMWKAYSEGAKQIEVECRGWAGEIRLRSEVSAAEAATGTARR